MTKQVLSLEKIERLKDLFGENCFDLYDITTSSTSEGRSITIVKKELPQIEDCTHVWDLPIPINKCKCKKCGKTKQRYRHDTRVNKNPLLHLDL